MAIDPHTSAPHLHSWLDQALDTLWHRRPVDATFAGLHDHDRALPDWSASGLRAEAGEIRSLLKAAAILPGEITTPVEDVDLHLAQGALEIRLWEIESGHFHTGNPALFTGEAVFGMMSLLLSDFAPLPDRIESLLHRMKAVPAFLDDARTVVRDAPADWTRRALNECEGALAFLRQGIPTLPPLPGDLTTRLATAATRGAEAFEAHRAHLQSSLAAGSRGGGATATTADPTPTTPLTGRACGTEALALLLSRAHALDDSPADIRRQAESALAEAIAARDERTAALGGDPAALQDDLASRHPTLDGYLARYGEIWRDMKALAGENRLVTWPDHPIRYVPRPAWARAAAPHLYFLFYRSPAAFARPRVHDYLVTPIDDQLSPAEQRTALRAHHDAVIKTNHVIHHGGIGHHVQNGHAATAPSRIGRIAALDGASRITLLCGGTMAEGWACYATDLMAEHGALTPLEEWAEAGSRIRMCARAIVDVALHTGDWSPDECARFYQETAGMSPAAARAETTKNSMFPGGALMYLVGTDGIHALRARERARLGSRFDLRRFHDRLLSFGSIPVSLARELLAADTSPAGPRAGHES